MCVPSLSCALYVDFYNEIDDRLWVFNCEFWRVRLFFIVLKDGARNRCYKAGFIRIDEISA